MAVCLVMKNNLKRSFKRISTYLFLFLIPLGIVLFGVAAESMESKRIQIGVIGTKENYMAVAEVFKEAEGIVFQQADKKQVRTDLIMGIYDQVFDADREDALTQAKKWREETKNTGTKEETNQNTVRRMVSMLITLYLVIATIYASKVIYDKEDGVIERFQYAGGKKGRYYAGYFLSTMLVVFMQTAATLVVLRIYNGGMLLSLQKVVLLALVISAVTASFGVGITAVCKKEVSANISASAVAVLCSVMGGTFVAVENMPGVLSVIGSMSPVYWITLLL